MCSMLCVLCIYVVCIDIKLCLLYCISPNGPSPKARLNKPTTIPYIACNVDRCRERNSVIIEL